MRRQHTTFEKPTKRWDKSRIDEEIRLVRDYGLKNKRELWKAKGIISKFRSRAREMFADDSGKEELFVRLRKLGIFRKEATLDDVLGLTVGAILERRLQTLVLRRGMANTPSQARQLITHRHVMLGGRVVDVPGHIVTVDEEKTIEYAPNSPISDKDHPIRSAPKPMVKPQGAVPGEVKVPPEVKAPQGEKIPQGEKVPEEEKKPAAAPKEAKPEGEKEDTKKEEVSE